ncbi:hypothetical protein [Streptomyces tauricus]|uniref:hypothetical protein n=1 Tax=Streptomyces tauricus TaxID=68274 RepID=UPI00224432AC|nr:hypothetical protein [Streptomyces tauricus]MCW8103537.1 hypothetical protein [Streptomyces tauricus]
MTDTLFRDADLIEDGDLVIYHGSITYCHGLYIATSCPCRNCALADYRGTDDVRYSLSDPWGEYQRLFHVRRQSITRSVAIS